MATKPTKSNIWKSKIQKKRSKEGHIPSTYEMKLPDFGKIPKQNVVPKAVWPRVQIKEPIG